MVKAKKDIVIICFAYKRPYHFKKCINSILLNEESKETPLIVYVDGPKNNIDKRERNNVLEFAKTIKGFKSVEIKERKSNLGLYLSLTKGITETLKFYKKAIIIEDDIFVSQYFLNFIINALSIYEEEKAVASIHGYLPPIKKNLPNSFFLRGADCWGWATWDDRWEWFRNDAEKMRNEIKKHKLTKKFNLNNGYDYIGMLNDKVNGFNDSWAICWHASCFLKNKLTLHPGKSLIKNIGLDNSGENCSPTESMESELFNKVLKIKKIDVKQDQIIFNYFSKYYKSKKFYLKSRISRLFRIIFINKIFNILK